jgi:hypothetical protein
MFPVFGFGGISPHTGGQISHCFPLTGDLANCEVPKIEGVVDIYKSTLPSIKFSGPTLFEPLLKEFEKIC